MFCMNCGSKLPDFAKFCFNCGFSVEKMFEENVEDDIAVKVENSQNVIIPKEEKFITFEILEGMKLSYVEGTDKISKYMGIFVNIMNEMSLDLYHKYNESKGIKSLLENTYNSFYCYMKKAVETACDILGENEIYDIGKTRFVKEYIQEYLDIYDDNYNQVVNEYFSILEDRDAMAAYRDAQKANRSRWVGGGFGIRGAIKGSIKASVLNAGFDFLHGIGDSMNESADNEEMNKKLASLYKKKSTRDILCNQPMILILGVYDELREILIDKLELSEKSAIYDVGRAAELFGDTVNSNYPNERKKENFVKCIGLFPAETKYYEAIIDDIFNQGKQGEVIRFLNFWGIDESFLEDLLDNS